MDREDRLLCISSGVGLIFTFLFSRGGHRGLQPLDNQHDWDGGGVQVCVGHRCEGLVLLKGRAEVSWVSLCLRDIQERGLSCSTCLSESDQWDAVLCALVIDLDFDGQKEVLLGTYGQVCTLKRRDESVRAIILLEGWFVSWVYKTKTGRLFGQDISNVLESWSRDPDLLMSVQMSWPERPLFLMLQPSMEGQISAHRCFYMLSSWRNVLVRLTGTTLLQVPVNRKQTRAVSAAVEAELQESLVVHHLLRPDRRWSERTGCAHLEGSSYLTGVLQNLGSSSSSDLWSSLKEK